MPTIRFKTKPFQAHKSDKVAKGVMVRLPLSASKKIPTRGMALADASIGDVVFKAVLEPDGQGSHWFRLKPAVLKKTNVAVGESIALTLELSKSWPEPKVPTVLRKALNAEPKAKQIWGEITPMARWDWIRWINAAKLQTTRDHRLEVAISKLNSGMRRACCFNRTECTLTDA